MLFAFAVLYRLTAAARRPSSLIIEVLLNTGERNLRCGSDIEVPALRKSRLPLIGFFSKRRIWRVILVEEIVSGDKIERAGRLL